MRWRWWLVLAVAVVSATTGGAKVQRCDPGTFVLDPGTGADLVSGGASPVTLELTTIGATLGVCGPTSAHLVGHRRGTTVSARWTVCGALRRLRLRGRFDQACATIVGTLAAKRIPKTAFVARRGVTTTTVSTTTTTIITGAQTSFEVDTLTLPTSSPQAQQLGFDLDGDGTPDNALGNLYVAMEQAGNLDFQSPLNDAVQAGILLLVHRLQADDLTNDGSVAWQVWLAQSGATPKFDGSDVLTSAPGAPTDAVVFGGIAGGAFTTTAPGPVTIELTFPGAGTVTRVSLYGARIAAAVSPSGCTAGRIGGAVLQTDLQSTLLPAMTQAFANDVLRDCTSPNMCVSNSEGEALLQLFDADHDGTITLTELSTSQLTMTLLAPDLDILDGQGSPGQDGVRDALSFGVGFTCVPVTFTP